MNKNNPYYNNEGYADPTAFYGTKQIVKEEAETERRANELIKVLKNDSSISLEIKNCIDEFDWE